jgi:hypothetical protein
MSKPSSRSWVRSLFAHRRSTARKPTSRVRLKVETFEDRSLPSASIPLNGFTWTHMGPSPITNGQAPGAAVATGRVNAVAVDSNNPNLIYTAADSGGLWLSADGGHTWSPRTDHQQIYMQIMREVNRAAPGTTVYAFDQFGALYTSVDSGNTYTVNQTPFGPAEVGAVVNKLVIVPGADQTQDILFAAVGATTAPPPVFGFPGGVPGSGIWRSDDGGATWNQLVDSTVAPFSTGGNIIGPDSLSFTDIALDPTNPNIAYVAIGATLGDPTNGVYKTTNALSATPTWTLLIGGSAFLPGEQPGNIKIAVSPNQPSVVFASLALKNDPQTGFAPLLGVFRSQDAGRNWVPVLLPDPTSPVGDPNNFMGISGDDNNFITVAPNGPTDPNLQTVIVGGFGSTSNNTVMRSTTSGGAWASIGIGSNGIGVWPNIHDGVFDNLGRLIFATGGGVFRLDSTNPVIWESLNGILGPNALDVTQMNGFALSPTDPNLAVGNDTFNGDPALNPGTIMHTAVLFADAQGLGNNAYGWQTIDASGIGGYTGNGQVIFNPFSPNIVYRVAPGNNGQNQMIRKSTDGGRTWTGATSGFQSSPFNPGLYTPPLAIDPSSPNRLFSGYNQVQVTDNNATSWSTSMQTTVTGGKTAIPNLPTTGVDNNHGGPIGLTAIGVGRESGVDFAGFGLTGVTVFVGTLDDATRDQNGNPQNQAAGTGPQLYVDLIPTNSFPWPPNGLSWGNRSWANITPTDPTTGLSLFAFGDRITQVLLDPANNSTLYVYLQRFDPLTGNLSPALFRGTNFSLTTTIDANKNIIFIPSITWTDLTGNLPANTNVSDTPQVLALDPQDNVLYAGTDHGVWKLANPAVAGAGTWTQIGLDGGGNPTMPDAPVSALSLNTTTGILAAATYGRGVYEIQVRGLITGHIFTDTNGDGAFQAGEPGIAGVTVEVLDQNSGGAIIASTTTDVTGFYQFRSLGAGNYKIVALVTANGAVQTTASANTFPGFTEQSQGSVNFGYFTPASVSGVVYNDANNNGIRDAGEVGLAGVTVQLLNGLGTLVGQTSSATDGSYSFAGLMPAVIGGVPQPGGGTYRIREVVPNGFVETQPAGGVYVITPTSGQAIIGENFGNFKNGGGGGGGGGTIPPPYLVTAGDVGSQPLVIARNPVTNAIQFQFMAYAPSFRGGVRLATANFGAALPDIVTVPGPGGGPHVEVFDGSTGGLIASFMAYDPSITTGLYVATGDVNGDGVPDIITGAGAGGGPHIKVFDGANLLAGRLVVDASFFAYAPNFTGGVTVAAGDVNNDGFADIVTGAGPGGGPHVEAFSGQLLSTRGDLQSTNGTFPAAVIRSFFAYAPNFTGGVFVAAADINGDKFADIITGPNLGGWPLLRIFDGANTPNVIKEGFAFPLNSVGQFGTQLTWTAGLRVAVTDFNQDGRPDIIVSGGAGQGPTVRILDALTFGVLSQYTVSDPSFLGGIFVAGD